MAAPRHRGVPLELGGTTYTVPAMSAGILEDYEERIAALQEGRETKPLQLVIDLLHRCLLRNYPDMSRDELRDFVDLNNFAEIFAMVMGVSGYEKWQAAQTEAAAGNAAARQTPASNGTGAPSTRTAPRRSAGRSTTAEKT